MLSGHLTAPAVLCENGWVICTLVSLREMGPDITVPRWAPLKPPTLLHFPGGKAKRLKWMLKLLRLVTTFYLVVILKFSPLSFKMWWFWWWRIYALYVLEPLKRFPQMKVPCSTVLFTGAFCYFPSLLALKFCINIEGSDLLRVKEASENNRCCWVGDL